MFAQTGTGQLLAMRQRSKQASEPGGHGDQVSLQPQTSLLTPLVCVCVCGLCLSGIKYMLSIFLTHTHTLQGGALKVTSRKQQEEWDKEIPNTSLLRLLRVNSPEWWLIAVGVLAAIVSGSIFPIYSLLLGEVLKIFQNSRTDQVLDDVTMWGVLFLGLACVSAVAVFFKVCCSHKVCVCVFSIIM